MIGVNFAPAYESIFADIADALVDIDLEEVDVVSAEDSSCSKASINQELGTSKTDTFRARFPKLPTRVKAEWILIPDDIPSKEKYDRIIQGYCWIALSL